jgi:hypothetical protein
MNICFVQDYFGADAWHMRQSIAAAFCCFGKISRLLLPITRCSDKVHLYVDETVNKQILECNGQMNRHISFMSEISIMNELLQHFCQNQASEELCHSLIFY